MPGLESSSDDVISPWHSAKISSSKLFPYWKGGGCLY